MSTNKTSFNKPENKYIQGTEPNQIIHMDLTDIPKDISNEDNKNFKLACIIDNLSKYAYAEIIQSKEAKEVLPVLMRYVNIKGLPKILITDNGKEFDIEYLKII